MELGQRALYFVKTTRGVILARNWYESASEFRRGKRAVQRLFPRQKLIIEQWVKLVIVKMERSSL